MANERLRAAMATARLGIEDVAEKVCVDARRVQRWLGGRVPHGRQRSAIATADVQLAVPRFDDQILVTPHLYGGRGYSAPLLHLCRKGGQGLFDSFAAHVESIWGTSKPAHHGDADPVLAEQVG